jgi:hypothetical protein
MLHNTTAQPGYTIPAPGVCNIFGINIVNPWPNLTYQYLDAGNPLVVRGPNGSVNMPSSVNSVGNIGYNATTGAGVPGNWMDPGTYTFTGPGSAAVGSFTINIKVPTEFVVTNPDSFTTINRATPLTVNWTGGDTSQLVFISGSSTIINGSTVTSSSFQCYEIGSAGHFTVPVSVLQQLAASSSLTIGSTTIIQPGSLAVSSITKRVRGFATGIDFFASTSSFNYSYTSRYQ